jgi:type I site-specific restriction endonuclease
MGVPVSSDMLIKNSTLQNKEELIASIGQQEQQQAQMAQQQQQAQIAVLQAQIEDLKARAMANEGLGAERASRIHENRALAVERIAAAQKDRDAGMLDRVRAAKELTSMDLDHLQRSIEILKSLTGEEAKESVADENSA